MFSFSYITGVKIDNLAKKKKENCCLDSPHCVFECERVQIISCDANPFALGSSHGDSSYYGYCMISVSATVQEYVCELYLRSGMYVLNGRPLALCRQFGSDGLIPVLTDLRSVLVLSPPIDTVDSKTSKS